MAGTSGSGSIGGRQVATIFPEEDSVYETILTLFRRRGKGPTLCIADPSSDSEAAAAATSPGVPNASAVGVKRRGDDILFTLYEGSNSFQAIDNNPCIGINIPRGPDRIDVFIRSALLGQGNDTEEFPGHEFTILDMPQEHSGQAKDENTFQQAVVLKNCSPVIIVRIMTIRELMRTDTIGTVRIKQVAGRAEKIMMMDEGCREGEAGVPCTPFSRAEGELMEALITATRYRATGKPELGDRLEQHLCSAEEFGGKRTRERVQWIRDTVYSSSMIE